MHKQARLLWLVPIPSGLWEWVSIDFIISLLELRGCDTIFVVVDLFCKLGYTELAFEIKTTFHCQTTNRQKNKIDGVLNEYLKSYVSANQRNWMEFGKV